MSQGPDITPDVIRAYLLELQDTGHNPGGRHAKYRALRVFLNWYEAEAELKGWVNPVSKIKPPKVADKPIEGVSPNDLRAMLATCNDGFIGLRDRAILLCLFDTGARAREFLSLNIGEVDTIGGVFLSPKAKAVGSAWCLLAADRGAHNCRHH